MRFRLSELLMAISCVAFACAALVQSTVLFECLFFSFTMAILFLAAILAIGRTGAARAFWAAFAATSGMYILLAHQPEDLATAGFSANSQASAAMSPRHNGPEFTTQLLRAALRKLHPDSYQPHYPMRAGGLFSVATQLITNRRHDDAVSGAETKADGVFGDAGNMGPITINLDPRRPALPLSLRISEPISRDDTSMAFMRCGHCSWALLFGWLAGHLAEAVYLRSRLQA